MAPPNEDLLKLKNKFPPNRVRNILLDVIKTFEPLISSTTDPSDKKDCQLIVNNAKDLLSKPIVKKFDR